MGQFICFYFITFWLCKIDSATLVLLIRLIVHYFSGSFRTVFFLVFKNVFKIFHGIIIFILGLHILILHGFDLILQILEIKCLCILEQRQAILSVVNSFLESLLFVVLCVSRVDAGNVIKVILYFVDGVNIWDLVDALKIVTLHQTEAFVVVHKCIFALHSFVLVG